MTPELSVVLPCYNEAGNICAILDRFRPISREIRLDLILVNNGSTDDSASILIKELSKPENSFARMVAVPRNQGYGYGIQQGLQQVRAPLVAYSHADLQCPPEALVTAFQLYGRQEISGACLVKGKRVGPRPRSDQFITWAYNGLAYRLLDLGATHSPVSPVRSPIDINAQPKLFHRSLIADLIKGPRDFTFDLYTAFAAHQRGWPIIEFDTVYELRNWGHSKLAANPWVRGHTAVKAFEKLISLRMGKYLNGGG